MRYLFFLILIIFISGCHFSGDCDDNQYPEQLKVQIIGKDMFIEHSTNTACCGQIRVQVQEEGTDLLLFEKNTGKECVCICGYKVNTTILNIAPGPHRLILYNLSEEGEPAYIYEFVIPTDKVEILD